MKPYAPQPGTIPASAYAWLLHFPKGTEKTSAEIAEHLGQPAEDIAKAMVYARERGIFNARRDGRLLHWSIAEPSDESEAEPNKPAESEFRAGLWTDGHLELRLSGKNHVLSPAHTAQLRDLLRGVA